MMKTILRTLPASFLALAVILLTACSGKEKPVQTAAPKAEIHDLRIGLMPITDCLPFYVAQENKMYKKNGVRVKIETFDSMLKLGAALQSGHLDGAYITLPQAIYINGRGAEIKLIMGTEGKATVVTSRERRIKKLSSIKGHTIAITRYSTSDFLVDNIASITKIPAFDLLRPQINSVKTRAKMLHDKQVDAAVLPSPYDELALASGNVNIYDTRKAKVNFGSICFVDSTIAAKPEKISQFIKAYANAAQLMKQKKHCADSVLIKKYGIPAKQLKNINIPDFGKPEPVNNKDFNRALAWCESRKVAGKKHGIGLISTKFVKK